MTWELRRVGFVEMDLFPREVVGKGRPRFTRSGRPYTPRKTRNAEFAIQDEFRKVCGERWAKFGGPVKVSICYSRQLAKSNPKFWAFRQDLGKPDLDNVAKLVLDSLNGLAYADDSQVIEIRLAKCERRPSGTGNLLHVAVAYYNEIYRKEEE